MCVHIITFLSPDFHTYILFERQNKKITHENAFKCILHLGIEIIWRKNYERKIEKDQKKRKIKDK